ncbi:hypothetical protein RRG08_046177 [Elysia crispata]|uniref:Uncharacterized protein n=1 Tax=Elysia crispata TaxID=231223 RepID=A0AAE0XPE9_9GAST|nr:hypothetical protein RRG08_046177 [Elysia crispata]
MIKVLYRSFSSSSAFPVRSSLGLYFRRSYLHDKFSGKRILQVKPFNLSKYEENRHVTQATDRRRRASESLELLRLERGVHGERSGLTGAYNQHLLTSRSAQTHCLDRAHSHPSSSELTVKSTNTHTHVYYVHTHTLTHRYAELTVNNTDSVFAPRVPRATTSSETKTPPCTVCSENRGDAKRVHEGKRNGHMALVINIKDCASSTLPYFSCRKLHFASPLERGIFSAPT